jgi:hypothetical protein
MLCPPPTPSPTQPRRPIDLRLAESYVPAVILWFKCMLYTCLVPTYYYSGSFQVPAVGGFLVVLYYDHIYMNPYNNFFDTTAIAIDVTAASFVALIVDIDGCWICQFVSIGWFICGCCHIIMNHDSTSRVPLPVFHGLCAALIVIQLSFASPGVPASSTRALTDVAVSFVRSAAYATLVLVDIYLLRCKSAAC